jgi:hypothetical protein
MRYVCQALDSSWVNNIGRFASLAKTWCWWVELDSKWGWAKESDPLTVWMTSRQTHTLMVNWQSAWLICHPWWHDWCKLETSRFTYSTYRIKIYGLFWSRAKTIWHWLRWTYGDHMTLSILDMYVSFSSPPTLCDIHGGVRCFWTC